MPLPTPKSGFPFVPFFNPHLVIGVTQIFFFEDLGEVEPVEHLRYEGEGEAVLNRDLLQAPIVDDEAKLAIGALDKHDGSRSRGFGGPNEAVFEVRGNISFHLSEVRGRHAVDRTPRGCVLGCRGISRSYLR